MQENKENKDNENLLTKVFYGELPEEPKSSKIPKVQNESFKDIVEDAAENTIEDTIEEQEEENEIEETAKKSKDDNEDNRYLDEINKLKKRLNESRAWGHNNSKLLIKARKELTQRLNKLQENGSLYEDDIKDLMASFNNITENEEAPEEDISEFVRMKNELDKEFTSFKRYNKEPDIDKKYHAFFQFFPMLEEAQREEILEYLREAKPDIALDEIITTGTDLYDTLYKGMSEKGGLVPYVKSLQQLNKKLQKRLAGLEKELDSTTAKVYPRTINSRALPNDKQISSNNLADVFRNG